MSKLELIAPQKHYKGLGLAVLICLLNMVNPLATDMYAPAIPSMAVQLGTTNSLVNLTLTLYFGGCAIGMLFSGPLADKYGRKPLLLAGTGMYSLGALACAFSPNIGILITARIFGSLGAGCICSPIMAVVKDCYDGDARKSMLSAMIATQMIGPVIAPVLGALLLTAFSWRAVFVLLTVLGAIGFAGVCFFTETVPERRTESAFRVALRPFALLKIPKLRRYLLAKSTYSAGYMGHVACGALIYVNFFGRTELEYSLFFAALGIVCVVMTYGCNAISDRLGFRRFFSGIILGSIILGVALPFAGPSSIWVFFVLMTVYCSITNGIQARATDAAFTLIEGDSGSLSGLITFSILLFGTIGMGVMALPWQSYFMALGVVLLVMFAIAGIAWLLLLKSGDMQ